MVMNYVVLVIIKGLKENNMKCSICNYNDIGEYGHNAQPVNNGRCCSYCNGAFVNCCIIVFHHNSIHI